VSTTDSPKPAAFRLHIRCPNCGTPSKAFKVRQLSEVTTEVCYDCQSESCGARFVFTGEVSRYLRVPGFVNPRVNVPLSPIVERRQLIEALENMGTARLPPEGELVSINEAQRQTNLFDCFAGTPSGP
jgi:ribosomal protein S27E